MHEYVQKLAKQYTDEKFIYDRPEEKDVKRAYEDGFIAACKLLKDIADDLPSRNPAKDWI